MILTEEDAKTKQCRQAIAAIVPQQARGAIAVTAAQQLTVGYGVCVASACMGWRVREGGGYCGFAGVPGEV